MTTLQEIAGTWQLASAEVAGKRVPDVHGRLHVIARQDGSGQFHSSSISDYGEQHESGQVLLDGDLMLLTILESSMPSMVGSVIRLRYRLEPRQMILQHVDAAGGEGDLVQYWERAN